MILLGWGSSKEIEYLKILTSQLSSLYKALKEMLLLRLSVTAKTWNK